MSFIAMRRRLHGRAGRSSNFIYVRAGIVARGGGWSFSTRLQYPGLNRPCLLHLECFIGFEGVCRGRDRWHRQRARAGAVLERVCHRGVEQFGSFYISPNYRDVYVFALLIAILLVKPSGLLGSSMQEKVYMSSLSLAAARSKSGRTIAPLLTPSVVFNSVWPLVAGVAARRRRHFTVPNAAAGRTTRRLRDRLRHCDHLAVSLNIANGMTGRFSLGHAAFAAMGGYAAGA